MATTWAQDYQPLSPWLSTVLAALPLIVLLGSIGLCVLLLAYVPLFTLLVVR